VCARRGCVLCLAVGSITSPRDIRRVEFLICLAIDHYFLNLRNSQGLRLLISTRVIVCARRGCVLCLAVSYAASFPDAGAGAACNPRVRAVCGGYCTGPAGAPVRRAVLRRRGLTLLPIQRYLSTAIHRMRTGY